MFGIGGVIVDDDVVAFEVVAFQFEKWNLDVGFCVRMIGIGHRSLM